MPSDKRYRRFRISGPLACGSLRLAILAVSTREMQETTELMLEFVAVLAHGEDEQGTFMPEPLAELRIGLDLYETEAASFTQEENTRSLEGDWKFHVPSDRLHKRVLQLTAVSEESDEGSVGRETNPVELEVLE